MRTRLALIAAVLLAAVLPQAVSAAAYDFRRFDATYVLDPSGVVYITEEFQLTFLQARHGLLWKVPVRYRTDTGDTRSIRLRVLSVEDEDGGMVPFETYREGDDLVVKIGDPDVTVTGPTFYRMRSVLERVWNAFPEHDEFYWNVIGSAHEDFPDDISATVLPPAGTDLAAVRTRCFAGPPGSTDDTRCGAGQHDGQLLFVAREPMTVVVGMPKGAIAMPTALDRIRWFVEDNSVFVLPIAMFALLFGVWWFNGRDAKGRHVIIAEYEPPEGMDALSMGTLLDAHVHPRDVAAGVVSLAVKGFLRMTPLGDPAKPKSWRFEKTDKVPTALSGAEKKLYDGLFEDGDTTTLTASSGTLTALYKGLSDETYTRLAAQNYFVRRPDRVRNLFYLIAVAFLGIAIGFPLGIAGKIAFGLVAIQFAAFGKVMPKVTHKGAVARDHARGFKLFLETAERDRLKWQEKEGMFEQYLPYAVVFGVVAQWAAAFAGALAKAPSWYAGTQWDPDALASSFGSLSSTVGTASHSASSGSSGFSSGGSSGGGFGGGGSSSW